MHVTQPTVGAPHHISTLLTALTAIALVLTASGTPASAGVSSEGGSATAVAGPGFCSGDCDADGGVSVAELVLAVSIALGIQPASVCTAVDADADGLVSIAELVAAVTHALNGCGPRPAFVADQHIVYSDGLHNENTEMIRLGDRLLLIFRGGEEGQIGSNRARIKVFESTNDGQTFTLVSEVNANDLPDGRDIRDPKLVEVNGRLFLYAISRKPGFHYRDQGGAAWTIRAESTDGGHTWSSPVRTYQDVDAIGTETFWGFWRYTKRQYTEAGKQRETLYATGYQDDDVAVGLFASEDGIVWEKRSTIIESYNDVPSEAELQFFGDNNDTAVALVRLDNQDILADGQTAVCTAQAPFTSWECGRRIEQRLDGPTWLVRSSAAQPRSFVFARKHLPCTFKRTAIYELRGDLADPNAAVEVCEIQEVNSSGDTAYTALAPLTDGRYLLSWYSSDVNQELPWFQGISSPSDIWLATIDFAQAPETCTHPAPKRACEPPPLPSGTTRLDVSGSYLLTLAPVIWPAQTLLFRADVAVHGATLDLTLQPLDRSTTLPVGAAWTATDVAIAADGTFTADFGTRAVPVQAYPLLNDPFLTVNQFTVTGATTSNDSFCGFVGGYGQVFGVEPSDRVRLEGSTFGAVRITGAILPAPIGSCSDASTG